MPALGKNFRIYLGDSMNTIGCEDSCTVNVTAAEIITTTKGSGRGTNREYGAYDATINVTGVVFPYDSESAAASAGYTDVTFLHSYLVQGKKVAAKYQLTDGALTKFVIANWIIRSITFTGEAEGALLFDMELALDGRLFESTKMRSSATYDGPTGYFFVFTGTDSAYPVPGMADPSKIYFIVINNTIYESADIQVMPDDISAPLTGVGVHFPTGTVLPSVAFAANDTLFVSYDIDD